MNDKDVMEGLLLLEKGVCDLYMHGTMESSTGNVHTAFSKALNESLCIQDDIYAKISEKGWYSPDKAEGTRIDTVKQKFSGGCSNCSCG